MNSWWAVVRGGRLRTGVLVLCAALAWTLSGVPVARASTAHTAAALPGPRAANAGLAAVREARLLGRPVQVAGKQSATTTVLAEPDGSMRAIITAVPTRVKRGAGWVSLDTTLARGPGGSLTPRAAEEPLTLSGGGASAPLVSLGSGADRLSLSWPGPLPAPRVAGDSATYPQVLPGVDLTVTATAAGFTELLVVRDRAAGMRLLAAPPRFLLSSPGLAVRPDRAGGLTAVDAVGNVVFAAPSARMWDATAGTDPAREDVTAPVGLSLSGSVLTVRPDRRMLTSPSTSYPVTVDPSFTAKLLNWTNPLAMSPGVPFWNGQNLSDPTDPNGPIMVGLDPTYGTDARALFQMNTSPVNGKHILGATFRITEGWANSCTASEVDLWLTGGISSATTWNSQPGWTTKESSVTTAHRSGSGTCPQAQIAFNATGAVQQAAASGWSNLTLGLRAANEGDVNSWKRFQTDASIQVDYNSIPTVGPMSTSPATACVSGGSAPASNDPVINNPQPTLTAYADTADTAENDLTGNFAWQSWNGSAWVAAGSGSDPIKRAANTQTSFTLPAGALSDGGTYRWQVRIASPVMSPYSGTDYSAWSQWCEFVADFAPPAAPGVSASVYTSGCASCGGVGIGDTFALSDASTDAVSYTYGFSDPPTVALTPASPGGSVSFSWTPSHGGPYTLYVQATDVGGNVSAETRYSFQVGAPSPMAGQWLLNEPAGSTTLADTTGQHPATLAGGTLGAPSRVAGVTALATTFASPAVPGAQTAGPVLDTSKSFTVAAWVKLTDNSAYENAICQRGANQCGFYLEYDHDANRWAFAGVSADVANPANNFHPVSLNPPALGVWTHLAGVYDAATGQASLYVNGVLQSTVTAHGPAWNATGPLTFGQQWTGSVSDVQVWQRVLFPGEIQALVDPSVTAMVEDNTFDSTSLCYPDPSNPVTLYQMSTDSSNMAHDLVLNGTAQVPPQGAGYEGTGLQLDGGGYADTSADPACDLTGSQVLHTDQSFTASAWVKLTGSSLPTVNMTALSQSGSNAAGFYLGYRLVGNGTPVWSFAMPDSDVPGSSVTWTLADSAALTSAALNTWTQLTGVYDVSANTLTLYVDGQLAASLARAATATRWDATGNFTVGAALWSDSANGSYLTDHWVGDIDDVRAYQGILVSPAGDWQFGNCTGSPVVCPDAGSGNHPVTLSGGASIVNAALPSSQPGPVLSLDGSSGVAATSAPVIDTTQSFTVGAWVMAPSVPSSGSHVIVSQSGNNKSFYELKYDADTSRVCFEIFNQDSTANTPTSACGPNLTAGQWMYVAGVYDAVNGEIELYTGSFGGAPALDNTAPYTSPWYHTGTNAELRIGAGYNGGGVPTAFFGGYVTDVQIYPGVIGDLSTLM